MTKKTFQFALFGAGWAGERHAHALRLRQNRAALAALAEKDPALLAAKTDEWNVPYAATHYLQLLQQPGLDAAVISLPHHLHAEAAIAALQAGLHVLIDKPLASSLSEADAVINAASASQRLLLVAENVRFDPLYRKASELITQGVLGEVFLIRINREHHMHAYLRQRPWFLTDPAGGIMMSGGIHDFEILRILAGNIHSIYAVTAPRMLYEMRADDTSLAVVEMECGIRAVIQESFSIHTPQPGVHGAVFGRDASLWFYKDSLQLYRTAPDGKPEHLETIQVEQPDTFLLILDHFLDRLDNPTQKSFISAEEQRKPLAAVAAAYQSIQTGLPVKLAALGSPELGEP